MSLIKYLISLLFFLSIVSCASLGTKVRVIIPEALPSLKKIAVWPIVAFPFVDHFDEKFPSLIDSMLEMDPDFKTYSESMCKYADSILLDELTRSGLFFVIAPDSIIKAISNRDSNFSRFDRVSWDNYQDLFNVDGFLITKLSFGRESGGINTYVTLFIWDTNTRSIVIEVKFNTKWGKSYLFEQSVNRTLPDAIHGAVNGLANKLREYPAFGGSYSDD